MKRYLKQILATLLVIVMAVPVLAYDGESYCENCGETCPYTLEYEEWGKTYHCIRWWCSNCGGDMMMGGNAGVHHFEHDYDTDYDVCEECGYEIDCECGEAECDHDYTYTEWDDCDWYEYCEDCDELLDEGTEHGDYEYDDWEYYNSSRHRRYYYCEDCGGDDGYETEYHDTDIGYYRYDSTRHEVVEYCYDCDSEIDSYYEDHGFSYGSWSSYSDSQHSRSVYCYDCGYSSYEYSSHSLSYGSWTSYNGTQHRRTVSCSTCSYSTTEYASHTITSGDWIYISEQEHKRTNSCSCGYSATEYAEHDLVYEDWTEWSVSDHERTIRCSCGYLNFEYERHMDADRDSSCDICSADILRFSVTVPAMLVMTMAEDGYVYQAANAEIINNSTFEVEISSVTVTAGADWTIVPYDTWMSDEKVDSRLIGFSLNGVATKGTGNSEALNVPRNWIIDNGSSFPLEYDAVVSATSEILQNEQVLTVVFVFSWALR